MYSRECLLCCCSYLNGESEKQAHLCRTIELSDYRNVGPAGCRTNGLSDYSYAHIFSRIIADRSVDNMNFDILVTPYMMLIDINVSQKTKKIQQTSNFN